MPVKILVADDSVTMRKIMEMTFAGEEAEVVTVDSGEAAVQKAQEIAPDVVFADLSMSGLDGYGVCASIKSVDALANTAVIVMASQHQAYDESKGADAGVDEHVVKPFDSQAVIDKLADVLKRPRMIPSEDAPTMMVDSPAAAAAAPAPPSAPKPPPPAPPKRGTPKHTVAFGAKPPGPPPPPPSAPKPPDRPVLELADEPEVEVSTPAAPARPSAPKKPAAPAKAAAAATSNGGTMAAKLEGLGLDKTQVEGVLALSREVIEQVVWEVVPELAEVIIREEIKRLTSE